MRVVPHGTGNDHLDLLTTRQRADLVVVGDLRVEAEVIKVLADDRRLQLTVAETLTRRLVVVKLLYELVEAELDKSLARDLVVVLGQEVAPFAVTC